MKLRSKMLMMSMIPLMITVVVICVVAMASVNYSMKEVIQKDLHAMAINEKSSISLGQGNKYHVDDDGNLWNQSSMNISNAVGDVDIIARDSKIHTAVYFGDTCYMSTMKDENGNRITGNIADAEITEMVLENAEEYFASNIEIEGERYFAYYIPIYNTGIQKPVGMVFVGMSRDEVNSLIGGIIGMIVAVSAVVMIVSLVLIIMIATVMTKRIKNGVSVLGQVADGDLTVTVDERTLYSKDEIGDISRAIVGLREKLVGVIGGIFEKSNDVNECSNVLGDAAAETTIAVEQVEKAVNEMAEGAGAQANDTQKATENVLVMGNLIEETAGNVRRLHANADEMEEKGTAATEILRELNQVNDKAKESINVIYEQTNATNESVKQISSAVNIISSIAEETNLLSLNASIEAARAGEQGRGFAVVADQIQKLAEQSNESARQIENIVASLINDSQREVEIMEDVKEIMIKQSEMVDRTGEIVGDVIKGISLSRDEVMTIDGNTKELDESRAKVVDLVQNLSAIAEENAASTEETSASATEVNATIQEMAGNAENLRKIAEELEESIKVFKI